jgi:hypothetical protein
MTRTIHRISNFSAPCWACLLLVPALLAQSAAQKPPIAGQKAPIKEGFPFTDEALHYSMNWQSGLSLGDATLTAHHSAAGWNFEVALDAGVPGFALADKYSSTTDTGICSQVLDRELSHAGKRISERTTFDQKAGAAQRVTLFPEGGGKSTYDVASCARDAVAFSYYARIELGQGRVPSQQQILFGSPYSVRMEYTGAQNIKLDKKTEMTDKLTVSVKGPRSDFHFDVFYARDPARTPLRIVVPAPVGTLTLDLVR